MRRHGWSQSGRQVQSSESSRLQAAKTAGLGRADLLAVGGAAWRGLQDRGLGILERRQGPLDPTLAAGGRGTEARPVWGFVLDRRPELVGTRVSTRFQGSGQRAHG